MNNDYSKAILGLRPMLLICLVLACRTSTLAEEPAPWKFVSISDFLNNDVDYPEPRWDDATDYVLAAIKAEQPDFVLVAGDLVMGRWSHNREHLRKMAAIYYPAWVKRMQAHGLTFYVAVGDHEIGDDPWKGEKRDLVPVYKEEFRKYLKMPENGPDPYKGLAYSVVHKNLLLVTFDPFEQDEQKDVQIRVSGTQLDWFRETLAEHQQVRHRVIMGHIPILPKWRARSSSRLSLPGGSKTPLWKLMEKHGADLYLCGEVHDITVQQKDGVLQVVHGSQPSNVPEFNYLVVTVHLDRLELELKLIETTFEGPYGKRFDPYGVDPAQRRTISITREKKQQGFRSVGTMVLNKQGGTKTFQARTGFFLSRYHDLSEGQKQKEK